MSDPHAPNGAAWNEVFAAEQQLLQNREHHTRCQTNGVENPAYLTGICLSGGGIRSATVSLGIMQTLAGAGLVRHLDYMSSVSGGGYAASAVAFGYARGAADADPDATFPFGAVDPEPAAPRREEPKLRFLRSHADYLAQNGLPDLATGAVVVARSLLLNIFLWVTIIGVGLALLMSGFQALMEWRVGSTDVTCRLLNTQCAGNAFFDAMLFTAAGLALAVAALMVGFSLSSWRLDAAPPRPNLPPRRVPQWLLALLAVGLAAAALAVAVHSLGRPGQWGAGLLAGAPTLWGELVPVAAVLGLAALGLLAIVVGPCWFCGERISRKYARRRFQESFGGIAMLLVLGLVVVGSLPAIRDLLARSSLFSGLAGADGRGPLSALVYLVSLGAALYGYYRAHLAGKVGLGSSFLMVAGSLFLCFGVLMLGYEVAAGLQRVVRAGVPVSYADAFTVTAPLVALLLAFVVNINDVGLGRYYRDRLMEAFMPDDAAVELNRLGPATIADRFRLAEVVERPDGERLVGPYPLVNVNVMTRALAGDGVARSRGGDNFVLGPSACGSTVTGWCRTPEVIDARLTLATAMATSGAAANPRGGFAGTGLTTNPIVAMAMSILSLRLGYWLRWHPGPWLRRTLNPHGNHVIPVASDITRQLIGLPTRPGAFIELTDGGHFENLGLYELVRRRCGLIIVCDGGDDRLASYAAFVAAARRIEEDFGATFDFDVTISDPGAPRLSTPAELVARPAGAEYPKDAEYAARGYFLGSVRYGGPRRAEVPMAEDGPDEGLVIYLKSALIPSASLVTRGYKGANADFPYELTADQFFSPEQFEAYRDVGVCITRQMLAETGLAGLFGADRPPLCRLRRNPRFHTPDPQGADAGPEPDAPQPGA